MLVRAPPCKVEAGGRAERGLQAALFCNAKAKTRIADFPPKFGRLGAAPARRSESNPSAIMRKKCPSKIGNRRTAEKHANFRAQATEAKMAFEVGYCCHFTVSSATKWLQSIMEPVAVFLPPVSGSIYIAKNVRGSDSIGFYSSYSWSK